LDILNIILKNQINLIIVSAILVLAIFDFLSKKNFKSQIVSLGVLGTFLGIFMGLQDFNPNDMKNSINTILLGLKTAFFTSIVGMGTAIILSIIQKIFKRDSDDKNQDELLQEISDKLDYLEKLDSIKDIKGIDEELKIHRKIHLNTNDKLKKIETHFVELENKISINNKDLIEILDINFNKMNNSLDIAIKQLSKGATQEIIQALKQVIQEFNQQLQIQFGENFVELNRAVINLLKWQENYKKYIEKYEYSLKLSLFSIEKSKNSLEIISSKNEEIQRVYKELEKIIKTYDMQIEELNNHLKTYALLSSKAEKMFTSIDSNISLVKDRFINLSDDVKHLYSDLTSNIKEENQKQLSSIKKSTTYIMDNINNITKEYEKNRKELDLIIRHFESMGEQIPKALAISLENLNRGLTSLTVQFQKDYQEIMNKYKTGLR
jgi:DNA repair exonuclease SbcCD ATPase subunit